ncbi:MAG: metallophosphoesterase family protein [Deltaproteobacteria bacterium]|nr:metallophosphoesterase family protein [Deltaproteobacteria bacterium]
MKAIGIISDAHGNPFGLQACIDKLRKKGIKKIYFLGDAVGYLPLAGEVLEILKQEDVSSIMGNHDAMLCGQIEIELDKSDIYGFKHLPERTVDSVSQELSVWQKRRELNIDGRKNYFLFTVVHGRNSVNMYTPIVIFTDLLAWNMMQFLWVIHIFRFVRKSTIC